jgi:hypothetical protein
VRVTAAVLISFGLLQVYRQCSLERVVRS